MQERVIYLNGKRYMQRITRQSSPWAWVAGDVIMTFAYRGIPGEFPRVINCTLR